MEKNNLIVKSERLSTLLSAWLKPRKQAQKPRPAVTVVCINPEVSITKPRPELHVSKELMRSNRRVRDKQEVRKLVYASSVAALSMKISEADAPMNEHESRAAILHLTDWVGAEEAARLVQSAKKDTVAAQHYTERIEAFFNDERGILKQVCEVLLEVACADGDVNASECNLLEEITTSLSLHHHWFVPAMRMLIIPTGNSPQALLGATKTAGVRDFKLLYRAAVSRYHPDHFMQASEYIRGLALERAKILSDAYQVVTRKPKQKAA